MATTGSRITTWALSIDGYGPFVAINAGYGYAGEVALVVLDMSGQNAPTEFGVIALGGAQVAFSTVMTDPGNHDVTVYMSAHTLGGGSNSNSLMVFDGHGYYSNSIGPEQTFTLVNLGGGTVAIQATAGPSANQYLAAMQGGWYPVEWNLGTGSIVPAGWQAPVRIAGPLLPLLQITNSAYRTNLSGQNLAGLSLANANMQGAGLASADLSGVTSLAGADFTGADLRGANLSGLSLAGAVWASADFSGTDLRGLASAAQASMAGAILAQCNLAGVNLSGAALAGADLSGATLDGADLTGANLAGATLAGASLAGTKLQGANLQGTRFDGCNLSTALFDAVPNFSRSAGNRTSFVNATLPAAVIGLDWSWLDLTGATITGIPANLAGLVADGALLPDGLSLQGVVLTGASFVGTQAFFLQAQGADLGTANLGGALLKGARLDGANLTAASLVDAYLIAPQAGQLAALSDLEAASVTKAFLFNTTLDGAHCDGVDFSGSLFVTASALGSGRASAVGASMNFAKFSDAEAVLAVFDGAQLAAANFSNASLVGASFQDNGQTATQLIPSSDITHTDASVYQADLRGANFTGANMDGLDMTGAKVSTSPGLFEKSFDGYQGQGVPVSFQFGATILGNTTSTTQCPDGTSGPCSLGG